jgi:cysteine desulfurase family protein (TIGR01976 family)
MPTLEEVRNRFPALAGEEIFMDNAGGSQLPSDVIDAVGQYMRTSFVQTGGNYPASHRATQTVSDAHTFLESFVGGLGLGRTIIGSSTSSLIHMIAQSYSDVLPADAEVIVAESGHEANVGPWMRLAKRGSKVILWEADSVTGICRPERLQELITAKTKLVAFPHVSNLLGGVEDISACTAIAHGAGARVIVDGVAYAPHLPVNVAEWGVDWYVFSTYKVFGPHGAALWGTNEALAELDGPNHYFIPRDDGVYRFELGGANHELCAGLLGTKRYLAWLGGMDAGARMEEPLTEALMDGLRANSDVHIVGPNSNRVPTVSFIHSRRAPSEIVEAAAEEGVGIKSGHFYSYRLVKRLGLDPDTGVARISLAHYNSLGEVERILQVIRQL